MSRHFAQLGPTWTQLGLTWTQLGHILVSKVDISCGRGCIFKLSAICVVRRPRWPQDGPKMASRCPRTAPRGPMRATRKAQGGPRAAQEGPRESPRWLQDDPKTLPSRFHVPSISHLMAAYLPNPPKGSQDPPRATPGTTQGPLPGRPKRPLREPKRAQKEVEEGVGGMA